MWVYSCFEDDEDMALAWAQHDLYFPSVTRPEVHIGRCGTLSYIWANVIKAAWTRGHPWLDRNFERLKRIEQEGFNHKLLQVPHEHMAAYFRWVSPRVTRDMDHEHYPFDLLESWKEFLRKEIPDLLSSNEALVSLAKSIVYRQFEEGDVAYRDFQNVLMRRYGFECVAKTWWADDVASRVGVPVSTSKREESCRERETA